MKVLRARNEQIRQLRYHTQQANLAYAQYFHWLYVSPTCSPQPANRHQQKAAALAATSGQQAVASNQQQAGHRHQAATSSLQAEAANSVQAAASSQQAAASSRSGPLLSGCCDHITVPLQIVGPAASGKRLRHHWGKARSCEACCVIESWYRWCQRMMLCSHLSCSNIDTLQTNLSTW